MLELLFSCFLSAKPVESYDEALRIAQTATQKKFPQDYTLYESRLYYDESNEVWHFRYMERHEPGEYLFGGIGPGVDIRKSDGKITYLKGQK